MITYILQCYPKNKGKSDLFTREYIFEAQNSTPFVQNKLVHQTVNEGFFVLEVYVVKGENAS